jgi:DsbC/DsbD-like thiol-disulfide interchange protein
MLLATITPPAKIESGNVTIGAEANWLVCEKSCVPGDVKLSISLPVGSAQPAKTESFKKWTAQLPTAAKEMPFDVTRRINYTKAKTGTLTLQLKWTKPVPKNIQWFPPASEDVIFTTTKVETTESATVIKADFNWSGDVSKKAPQLDSVLVFTSDQGGRTGLLLPLDLREDPRASK